MVVSLGLYVYKPVFVRLLTLDCALGDCKYPSVVSLLHLTVSHHCLQCEISVTADFLSASGLAAWNK